MIFNLILFFGMLTAITSCGDQNQKATDHNNGKANSAITDTIYSVGKIIRSIVEDEQGHFWFGTEGEGVYGFDPVSKNITHYTDQQGLPDNYVITIATDRYGVIWVESRDGVSKFNGKSFSDYTQAVNDAPFGGLQYTKGSLYFSQLDGVCYFDGKTFTSFPIHPDSYKPEPNNLARPYAVYYTYEDRSGNIWFGTEQMGVCRFDPTASLKANGSKFTWYTEEGLSGVAVRAIFEDSNGNMWFGNSGVGVFRFDGKKLTNMTKELGLGLPEVNKSLTGKDQAMTNSKPREGTLSGANTINQDAQGDLWFGTFDEGVWRYDGKKMIQYTMKDGLSANGVMTIYKDRAGELWFGTYGGGVCKFDGKRLEKVVFR